MIDGNGGSDTLKLSIAGTGTGNTSITGVTMSDVETIEITNFETSANGQTLDASLFTGVTSAGLTASSATGDTTITGLVNLVDVNYKNNAGDLTVTYPATYRRY